MKWLREVGCHPPLMAIEQGKRNSACSVFHSGRRRRRRIHSIVKQRYMGETCAMHMRHSTSRALKKIVRYETKIGQEGITTCTSHFSWATKAGSRNCPNPSTSPPASGRNAKQLFRPMRQYPQLKPPPSMMRIVEQLANRLLRIFRILAVCVPPLQLLVQARSDLTRAVCAIDGELDAPRECSYGILASVAEVDVRDDAHDSIRLVDLRAKTMMCWVESVERVGWLERDATVLVVASTTSSLVDVVSHQ